MNLYHKDQAFGAFQDAFDYVCSYSKDNRGEKYFKKYILNKCLLITGYFFGNTFMGCDV